MFINSDAIVPVIITFYGLTVLAAAIVVGLALWVFRMVYRQTTGRSVPFPGLSAAAAVFVLLASVALVISLVA
jgi:hypothetical protein